MSIYLIRHTTPLVEKGICYGQSDLDVTGSFEEEATVIQEHLPAGIKSVYTSPLQRCTKLAARLFPHHTHQPDPRLMEIDCGKWEMQHWDAMPRAEIDPWMTDFVNVSIPGGESYVELFERVTACFEQISLDDRPVAVVTHGGVIRSILAYINNTPLQDSFNAYKLHYGCVVSISGQAPARSHEVHCNIEQAKEQHKPSWFKTSGKAQDAAR